MGDPARYVRAMLLLSFVVQFMFVSFSPKSPPLLTSPSLSSPQPFHIPLICAVSASPLHSPAMSCLILEILFGKHHNSPSACCPRVRVEPSHHVFFCAWNPLEVRIYWCLTDIATCNIVMHWKRAPPLACWGEVRRPRPLDHINHINPSMAN